MAEFDTVAALDTLCENILNTRYEDLEKEVIENTKRRILDMIGCAIGGAAVPGNPGLAELVKDWGGKPEATVLGYGFKVPVHIAAMINCLFGRSLDWGPLVVILDNGDRNASHNSETTVLTAVTMGEYKNLSGRELITSLVTGDDLVARVQLGFGGGHPGKMPPPGAMRRPGFDEWGTKTTYGAAAIAGRILGLTPFQLKNAFGIAINMMAGAGGGLWDGAHTFKLSQGTAARSGINAAQLARTGWVGINDPLGTFYATFSGGITNPDIILGELGKKHYVEVVHKPWPGGRPTSAASQLASTMAEKFDIKPEEVAEAIYRTSPGIATAPHYTKPYKVGHYPTGDALFSFVFAVGNGLATRQSKAEKFTEESIRRPIVQETIAKVKLEMLDKEEGVELEIHMKDGKVYKEYLRMAIGDPSNPLSREGLIDKFMGLVEFSKMIDVKDAEKIIELVENLENVDNVQDIVKLAGKKQ